MSYLQGQTLRLSKRALIPLYISNAQIHVLHTVSVPCIVVIGKDPCLLLQVNH